MQYKYDTLFSSLNLPGVISIKVYSTFDSRQMRNIKLKQKFVPIIQQEHERKRMRA